MKTLLRSLIRSVVMGLGSLLGFIFNPFAPPPWAKGRRRKGYMTTIGVIDALCRALIFLWAVSLLLKATGLFHDDSDAGRFSTSGMAPLTDSKTGVQYLYRNGALTPRLKADGTLMTVTPEAEKK